MISVTEAKKIIIENTKVLPPRQVSLADAAGLVLAGDVSAAITMPGFPQSSMDGYAFSFDDWSAKKRLVVAGMVAAGDNANQKIEPGTAVRIFTGAAVPPGADTVVMQEKTIVQQNELIIKDNRLERGMFIRPEGSEIKLGEPALSKGSLLTPAAVGFLTAIGIVHVTVYPLPTVCIIVTGDELQEPGKELQYGQVFESNSIALKAALQQFNIRHVKVIWAKDNLAILTETMRQAITECDLVFLTGGISVGDFDFVLQATINNSVQQLFHKIKQRPAKPLYFGKKGNTYIFGLPGNPASGLTSFYEYALPAIGIMCNRNFALQKLKVPVKQGIKKLPGLTHFLKGWYDGESVEILGAQESYRLSSFAKANCLVQVDEEITDCADGSLVEIHLLPA